MEINLQIEYVPIEEIKKYKNNAKIHTEKQIGQIVDSIKAFGFNDPIGIWKGEIVEGNGRYEAAKILKMDKVPIIRLDHLSDKDRKIYILTHNKLTINTGFEVGNLAIEFEDIIGEGGDLGLTGFDPPEVEMIFSEVHDKDISDDDGFDLGDALKEASFAKRGDIWTVGRHRIMCGDATSPEDFTLLMDGKQANLCLTDPPYGISYTAPTTGLTLMNDDLKGDDFYKFLLASFQNISSSLMPGGSIYVFHADTEGLNFRKAFLDAKYHLSGVCIWVKQNGSYGRSIYKWAHEPILFGFKKGAAHKWYSDDRQTTIWHYDKPPKNELHATMKPVTLVSYPIKNSAPVNGIVVDAFLGSGSTVLACEQTDRICYGMELDDKFVSVTLRRTVEFLGSDKDVFVLRDGENIPYSKLVKEVKKKEK